MVAPWRQFPDDAGRKRPSFGDRRLQVAFLRDPRATLDLSCLDQAAPPDWDGDPAFNRSLMGQASRWGGRAR